MNRLDHPLELALARTPDQTSVPIELVRRQQSAGAAFSLACLSSGLDDKEIYLQIGVDAGTFSRMKKGEATLQVGEFLRRRWQYDLSRMAGVSDWLSARDD